MAWETVTSFSGGSTTVGAYLYKTTTTYTGTGKVTSFQDRTTGTTTTELDVPIFDNANFLYRIEVVPSGGKAGLSFDGVNQYVGSSTSYKMLPVGILPPFTITPDASNGSVTLNIQRISKSEILIVRGTIPYLREWKQGSYNDYAYVTTQGKFALYKNVATGQIDLLLTDMYGELRDGQNMILRGRIFGIIGGTFGGKDQNDVINSTLGWNIFQEVEGTYRDLMGTATDIFVPGVQLFNDSLILSISYTYDGSQSFYRKANIPVKFNNDPTNTTIPTQSAQLGTNKTVNLSNYFSDPDGDVMTYTASLGNPAIGAVSVNGSTLTLTPKVLGSTTITVTANDGKGGTKSTTFTFSVTNSAPTVNLTAPTANQTLYENDVFNITGTASDTDNGNSVTIRYQINANTVRAIKAFVSDGTTLEAFSKSLRFSGGSLYDGETLIASGLTDGVAHKLKVWATDDQGGQSVIVERDFYVVPNRAPRLEVTPPVIDGVIDSDTFTIAGTYADADKNETVISYRINGSASKEVARGTSGTFDFPLSLSQLTVGQNTIVVDALDSYGAKTSRTIKLHKNTIATPLLQSTVRYLIQPPKGSAQAVLLWLQRDQELAVTASLHMGMKGEAEAFTLLEPTNTAPLRDNAAILEDEFYREADSAKDHIILQLDMKRSSVESTAAIHLISGVFE